MDETCKNLTNKIREYVSYWNLTHMDESKKTDRYIRLYPIIPDYIRFIENGCEQCKGLPAAQ